MTLPPLFHVALKTSEEIERESELKRAYEQGYKAGCASHSDAGKEREMWCGDCGFKESETCNDETTWKRCRLMSSEPEGKNVEARIELARQSARLRVLKELEDWAMPEFNELDGDGR